MKNSNEIEIAQKLIRCKSIAPNADPALKIVEKECKAMGFKCTKLRFSEKDYDSISNLYAEIGNGKPHFSFAGHVDVVPANNKEWEIDPFAGKIKNNFLIGRGAVDMKSAIACFISATKIFLHSFSTIFKAESAFGAIDLHRINFLAISISLEFFIYFFILLIDRLCLFLISFFHQLV